MNGIIPKALAVALVSVGVAADAVEPGVYKSSKSARMVMTDKHVAAAEGEGKLYELGSWSAETVGGKNRIVLRMWRNKEFWETMDPKYWVFEETGDGLRLLGHGAGPVTNAIAEYAEYKKIKSEEPELMREKDGLTDELAQKVNTEALKFLRKRKAHEDKVELCEFGERLKANPDELLGVEPECPELDPDEDKPDVRGMMTLYPEKMKKVLEALGNRKVAFREAALIKFLDRVDWEKGDITAFMILSRDELTSETLCKQVPKVFARFGKSDDRLVSLFFENVHTPRDVLESARACGGFGDELKRVIDRRLAGYK